MMNNRFNLPDISFVDMDPERIESRMVQTIENELDERLAPADPRRLLIKSFLPAVIQMKNEIEYSAKQNLLSYAEGEHLDHIGTFANTERLEAIPSQVTMRFHFSKNGRHHIPKGTRVSPDYELMYQVTEHAFSEEEDEYIDVICICEEPGTIGNGYLPGQIEILVDPLPYVESIENITESNGGYDREDDDAYAYRIHLSPESFSTAGPTGAYKYFTLSAHPSIVDAFIDSPSPTEINVYPLLKGGELPTEEILEKVRNVLSDEKIRPFTDKVTVDVPVIKKYNVALTYWGDEHFTNEQHTLVQQAVQSYVDWQATQLGRALDPSELIHRVKKAGAKRVEVTSPIHTILKPNEIAHVDKLSVQFGGFEYD